MAPWRGFLSVALAGTVTLAGCAPWGPYGCHGQLGMSASFGPEPLPLCRRGDFTPELDGPASTSLPETQDIREWLPYGCLRGGECQCLAVQFSTMANVLELEGRAIARQAAACKIGGQQARHNAELQVQMLGYLALEDRNRSAAQALDRYYRLGESEAKWDLLQLTLTQVTEALGKVRALKAKGVVQPVEEAALYRRQLELQARAVQLQHQIRQLNSELRRLLGFDPCGDDFRYWPVDAFRLDPAPVDPEEAVAVALGHRPELLALRLADAELEAGNLAVVRQQLRMLNGALGQEAVAQCPKLRQLLSGLCDPSAKNTELWLRKEQLHLLLAHWEHEVVEETRQAGRAILAQMEVVVLSRQRAKSWRALVQEVEEKETKGLGSFAEAVDARVEWLQAQGKLAEEMTNLQRARTQLRQAQGVLPMDCLAPSCQPGHDVRTCSGAMPALASP